MEDRTYALVSCLCTLDREQRAIEAAKKVIGRAMHDPTSVPAQNVKTYAKYHRVRIAEVKAVLERVEKRQNVKV